MRIAIEMAPDEMTKAREAAVAILSKLAPYDEDVAKALEGMLTDDFVGRLPDAVRALLASATSSIDSELAHLETLARTP